MTLRTMDGDGGRHHPGDDPLAGALPQTYREHTTPTFSRCWGRPGAPFGLNVYLRGFWRWGPHVRWQVQFWLPGLPAHPERFRWGNADLDFEPLTPEDELELMGWGVHPAGGHDHA